MFLFSEINKNKLIIKGRLEKIVVAFTFQKIKRIKIFKDSAAHVVLYKQSNISCTHDSLHK